MNGLLIIKENQFIEIPTELEIDLNSIEEKTVLEIGKGDKTFLSILKYCSAIGIGFVIYSLIGLG
tara:strand:- start:112 stop:306 length:195 start_codon:yes stop_codon:yes gene_type:complete